MRRPLSLLVLLLLLPACPLRPPDPFPPEAPPGPLLQSLDVQRGRFISMKAVGRVETERNGKRRSYESVSLLLQGTDRLRVDGFGPLGETQFSLLWDGNRVLLRQPGEPAYRSVGRAGLERALGAALAPAELCALLAGNVPPAPKDAVARAGCTPGGACLIELRSGGQTWRARFSGPVDGPAGEPVIDTVELIRGGRQAVLARFESRNTLAGYAFPMRVQLLSPERGLRLTVEYEQVDVNVPVEDGAFVPEAAEEPQ